MSTAVIVAIITALGSVAVVLFTKGYERSRLATLERITALKKDVPPDNVPAHDKLAELQRVLSSQLFDYYDFAPGRTCNYIAIAALAVTVVCAFFGLFPELVIAPGTRDEPGAAGDVAFVFLWASFAAGALTVALKVLAAMFYRAERAHGTFRDDAPLWASIKKAFGRPRA